MWDVFFYMRYVISSKGLEVLSTLRPENLRGGARARLRLSRTAPLLVKIQLPGNLREIWVPKGKLLAGPIATLLEQDSSISPLGTFTHLTRKL